MWRPSTYAVRQIAVQALVILGAWVGLVWLQGVSDKSWWEIEVPITAFIAVPAAVIAIAQLFTAARIQRAAYIKDYALRFRTDRELSESFHYLVYRYGNAFYELMGKDVSERSTKESERLAKAQQDVPQDLRFYLPLDTIYTYPERRLDNLLGFFDTLGFDYHRGMVSMDDVAGVFGLHLDHLIQRHAIRDYLNHVEKEWPNAKSFHELYESPTPYQYLRILLSDYATFRKLRGTARAKEQ